MENAELDKVVPSFKKVIPFIEKNAHSYNIEGYIFFSQGNIYMPLLFHDLP